MNKKLYCLTLLCLLKLNSKNVENSILQKIKPCDGMLENQSDDVKKWSTGLLGHNLIRHKNGSIYNGLENLETSSDEIIGYLISSNKNNKQYTGMYTYNYLEGAVYKIKDSHSALHDMQDGEIHAVAKNAIDLSVMEKVLIDYNIDSDEQDYLKDIVSFFQVMRGLILQYEILTNPNISIDHDQQYTKELICSQSKLVGKSVHDSLSDILDLYHQNKHADSIKEDVHADISALHQTVNKLKDTAGSAHTDDLTTIFGYLGHIALRVDAIQDEEIYTQLQISCNEVKELLNTDDGQNILEAILNILRGQDAGDVFFSNVQRGLISFFGANNPADFNRILNEVSNADPEYLKGQVRKIDSDIQSLLDNLNTKTEAIKEKILETDVEIDKVKQKTNKLLNKSRVIDGKIDGINNAIGQVDSKVDDVSAAVGQVDTKVDGIDTVVGKIRQKSNQIIAKANAIDGKVDDVSAAVGQVDTKVDTVGNTADQIEIKVDRIEMKASAIDGKVDDVSAAVGQVSSKVDGMNTQISSQLAVDCNDNIGEAICHIKKVADQIKLEAEEIDRQIDYHLNPHNRKDDAFFHALNTAHGDIRKIIGKLERFDYAHITNAMKNGIDFSFTAYVKSMLADFESSSIDTEHALSIVNVILDLYSCPVSQLNDDVLDSIMHIASYVEKDSFASFSTQYIDYIRERHKNNPMNYRDFFRIASPALIRVSAFSESNNTKYIVNAIYNSYRYIWNNYNKNPLNNLQQNNVYLENLDNKYKLELMHHMINRCMRIHDTIPLKDTDIDQIDFTKAIIIKFADELHVNDLNNIIPLLSGISEVDDYIEEKLVDATSNESAELGLVAFKWVIQGHSNNNLPELVAQRINEYAAYGSAWRQRIVNFFISGNIVEYDNATQSYIPGETSVESYISIQNKQNMHFALNLFNYRYDVNELTSNILLNINQFIVDQFSSYYYYYTIDPGFKDIVDEMIEMSESVDQFSRNVMRNFKDHSSALKQTLWRFECDSDLTRFSDNGNNEYMYVFLRRTIEKIAIALNNELINASDYEDAIANAANYLDSYFGRILCYMKNRCKELQNSPSAIVEMSNILLNYKNFYREGVDRAIENASITSLDFYHIRPHLSYVGNNIVSSFNGLINSIADKQLLREAFKFISPKREISGSLGILTKFGELESFAKFINQEYGRDEIDISEWIAPII
ncbi:hypothetical protein FZC35_00975 [Candidatus Cytomitobacter indipagum]|uniref:Uncharacterized protein n=1 Tax=Candidatus Cytomitobacter indipagum TaxID=2601575 RepID=A0A5C0UFY5_9PROT|nr:hypothetical protein [Candidatus Cytomitobacter indipagum]QEK37954.1 hypothetical protein FZC35_00975 [Candidatus Cytomitobacter indipagum]